MTPKENEVFLGLPQRVYNYGKGSTWSFFAQLACQDGEYIMCGESQNKVEQ